MKLRNLIMMMLDEMASGNYESIWICTESEENAPVYVICDSDKNYKEKAMSYLRVFGYRRVIKVEDRSVNIDYINYKGYRVIVKGR